MALADAIVCNFRRTGGHTRRGVAYLAVPGLEPGERGVRSSFDVIATIAQLLGAKPTTGLAGQSLLSALSQPAQQS